MTLAVNWRVLAAVAILAFIGWVGFEIGRAGSDIRVQRGLEPGSLTGGQVVGKRLDGKSWSLDYDSVTMTPDNAIATIAHVRDGRIHRPGKPDVRMQGDDVQVNTATNDLVVSGHVKFIDPEGGGRTRTFETRGARYIGPLRQLQLDHTSTITDGTTKLVVSNATIDFRTGDVKLGKLEGTSPSAPQ
ncbi:MAG TPA: hypothetical protein VHT53_08210 [Candidatus Elarobacter sp.]|nr:hypothetical protein [Candidatus Elarobacter sp.]